MRKTFLVFTCIGLFGSFSAATLAQTPSTNPPAALQGIKANLAVGEVSSKADAGKLSLQTTDGAIDVMVGSTTGVKRVPPENPKITAAVDSSMSEVSVGDKLVVTGTVSADKKTIAAKNIYIMSKADIAKRDTSEREAWRTRSVSGKVVSVDAKTQQITLAPRGTATANIVVTPKENAVYRRYSQDSAKFSDAKASSLGEIKVGDEVRALGDKNEDGSAVKAEQIVSGAFKTVVGKITAIDPAKNEITIQETGTDKTATVVVNQNTMLKKFPADIIGMFAGGGMGGGRMGGGGQPGGNQNRPAQGRQSGQPSAGQQGGGQQGGRPGGMGGGMGGMMRGDLDAMINRLPSVNLPDLKVGDAIGVSSMVGNDPNRFTAIKLLSGIEPFLAMQSMGRGGRGGAVSVDIPGLEGGFGEP